MVVNSYFNNSRLRRCLSGNLVGKFFGSIIIILGIGTVALPSGILASAFTEHTKRNQKKYEDQLKLMLSDNVIDEKERKELEELISKIKFK